MLADFSEYPQSLVLLNFSVRIALASLSIEIFYVSAFKFETESSLVRRIIDQER